MTLQIRLDWHFANIKNGYVDRFHSYLANIERSRVSIVPYKPYQIKHVNDVLYSSASVNPSNTLEWFKRQLTINPNMINRQAEYINFNNINPDKLYIHIINNDGVMNMQNSENTEVYEKELIRNYYLENDNAKQLFNVKLNHRSQRARKPISPPKQKYEMTKERFFEIKDAPMPCLIQPHYDIRGDVVRCRFTYNGKREELLKGYKKVGYEAAQKELVAKFNARLNELQTKFNEPTETTHDIDMGDDDDMSDDTESVCSGMSVENDCMSDDDHMECDSRITFNEDTGKYEIML